MIGASAALSLGAAGCLAPQDDDLLPPIIQLNRALWIVPDQARASGAPGEFVDAWTGCENSFTAVVEDPDINDRIEFRWYVKRLPVNTSESAGELHMVEDGYLTNTGQPRRKPQEIKFKSGQVINRLAQPGTYHVQFMAFDGALQASQGPGSVPQPEPIPGVEGILNPRFADVYTWTVRMELGNDCGPEGELP